MIQERKHICFTRLVRSCSPFYSYCSNQASTVNLKKNTRQEVKACKKKNVSTANQSRNLSNFDCVFYINLCCEGILEKLTHISGLQWSERDDNYQLESVVALSFPICPLVLIMVFPANLRSCCRMDLQRSHCGTEQKYDPVGFL